MSIASRGMLYNINVEADDTNAKQDKKQLYYMVQCPVYSLGCECEVRVWM